MPTWNPLLTLPLRPLGLLGALALGLGALYVALARAPYATVKHLAVAAVRATSRGRGGT